MPDRFTDSFVRGLKPDVKEYVRRDAMNPGLAVRVHPTGRKTWIFYYDYRGRRRKMTLGMYPDVSLRSARDRYHEARLARNDGKDPGQVQVLETIQMAEMPNVEELAEAYVERHARHRKLTWQEDRRILDRDVLPHWRFRPINEIRRRDVAYLLDAIAARGARFTANATQVVLSSMFNYAVEMEYLPANPAAGLSKRGKYVRRERSLSDRELTLFFQALEEHEACELRSPMYLLQLLTATRPGEIRQARWEEFDFEEGTWHLAGVRTKNQRPHTLPLSSFATEVLGSFPRLDAEWMFPSPAQPGPIGKYNQSATIRRLFARGWLEIEHFTPHDLRRTATTHLARLGVERMIISKILNHLDEHQTATYDRYTYMKEKREALEMWGEHLRGLTAIGVPPVITQLCPSQEYHG